MLQSGEKNIQLFIEEYAVKSYVAYGHSNWSGKVGKTTKSVHSCFLLLFMIGHMWNICELLHWEIVGFNQGI